MKRGMLNAFPIGYATKLASETPGHEKAAYETFFLAFANPFVNARRVPVNSGCIRITSGTAWTQCRPTVGGLCGRFSREWSPYRLNGESCLTTAEGTCISTR